MNNYMSKNDLAKSLGVSLATINRKLKEIPHVKMGDSRQSRILFNPENVKEYLKKFEVNAERKEI
jgi:DeoR/GlpR family transcriptional regulator of sugar metabolism